MPIMMFISGASDAPWQFERDAIYIQTTQLLPRFKTKREMQIYIALEEEYIPLLLLLKRSILAIKEIKRKVSQFWS